jgi:hypothetical protein
VQNGAIKSSEFAQKSDLKKEPDVQKTFLKSETAPVNGLNKSSDLNIKPAPVIEKSASTLDKGSEKKLPVPSMLPVQNKIELKPKSNTMDFHSSSNATIDTTEQLVKGEKKSLFKNTLNNVLGKGPAFKDDFIKHTNPNKDELNRVKGRRPSKTYGDSFFFALQ